MWVTGVQTCALPISQPIFTSAATATRQTGIPPLPHSPTPPRAPWIPPRQAAPTNAPPYGQQRGEGYLNSRMYSYFTPGLDALNQQEEE